MVRGLSAEQINQVVNNTVVVLLARPDLQVEWRSNLNRLLVQVQEERLEDESIFIAAVLNLLHHPDDVMPTGTRYDRAWESILTGVQTGMLQSTEQDREEQLTLERLLNSIAQAALAVIREGIAEKTTVEADLNEMRTAAVQANVPELVAWIDDVVSLLNGTPLDTLGQSHQGIYAAYWAALAQNLD